MLGDNLREDQVTKYKTYAHAVADRTGLEKFDVFPFLRRPIGAKVYIWWRAEMTVDECVGMVEHDFKRIG